MATTVYLGNHDAVETTRNAETGQLHRLPLDGKRCTTVHLPDDVPRPEAVQTITGPGGVWAWHSDAKAPAWVASDDPVLAQVLAGMYGCDIRDPQPEV